MKKNEGEGFFSRVSNSMHKRFGMVARSLVDAVLVKWLDDWQAVIQLIAFIIFFAGALPMGITYLGIWHGGIYAYAYAFLCIGLAILLANREANRRDKTLLGSEWVSFPKAIGEYIALLEKDDSA